MVCEPSFFHKRPFPRIAPPQTFRLLILPVAAACRHLAASTVPRPGLCRRVWPFTAFPLPFSKNRSDYTPSKAPCPVKLSLYDTVPAFAGVAASLCRGVRQFPRFVTLSPVMRRDPARLRDLSKGLSVLAVVAVLVYTPRLATLPPYAHYRSFALLSF